MESLEHVAFTFASAFSSVPNMSEDSLHLPKRPPLECVPREERDEGPRRVDERFFWIELLEEVHELGQVTRRSGFTSRPAAERDAMHEHLHVREDLDLARGPEAREVF